MHIIIKVTPGMTYTELWLADHSGKHAHLAGHFNLTLAEQNTLIDTIRMGTFETRNTYELVIRPPAEHAAHHAEVQHEVDRVFEEAAKGVIGPPMPDRVEGFREIADEGAGEHPLPPTGNEHLHPVFQKIAGRLCPVSIPDPVGRPGPDSPRFAHGRDGTEQAAKIRASREAPEIDPRFAEAHYGHDLKPENAQQGGAIASGEASAPTPLVGYGGERFIAVCDVSVADPEFRWNVIDGRTRLYRMPGFVLNEETARRTAERANANPLQFASRYQWKG